MGLAVHWSSVQKIARSQSPLVIKRLGLRYRNNSGSPLRDSKDKKIYGMQGPSREPTACSKRGDVSTQQMITLKPEQHEHAPEGYP
ncbi:hypothetical protein V4R08_16990 (plasmid) [Nitrobacter sp. NHB1]|uniref:hypothetical protein n=1 Tax=Nitrobacter sp. NHB1 TaxID=3119830 RepID=UPI002FFE7FFB